MAADVALGFPSEPPFSPDSVLVVTFYAVAWFVTDPVTQSQDRL